MSSLFSSEERRALHWAELLRAFSAGRLERARGPNIEDLRFEYSEAPEHVSTVFRGEAVFIETTSGFRSGGAPNAARDRVLRPCHFRADLSAEAAGSDSIRAAKFARNLCGAQVQLKFSCSFAEQPGGLSG